MTSRPTRRILVDVDTGADDAIALMLACGHPEIEIVGVTVVIGNGSLDVTVRNTLAALAVAGGSDVPVYRGAERHLLQTDAPRAPAQDRILDLPEGLQPAQPLGAVELLIRHYSRPESADTILVTLAPLTNLALALRQAPEIARHVPRIVMMGGAFTEGNTTPSAEFNIYADPEAAHIVFESGIPITMVGLEVTRRGGLSLAEVEEIHALGSPAGQAAARLMREEVESAIRRHGGTTGEIYDACAMAAVIDPAVVETRPASVAVELRGELTRGRTVVAFDYEWRDWEPNAEVGVDIDKERFLALLKAGFSPAGPTDRENGAQG